MHVKKKEELNNRKIQKKMEENQKEIRKRQECSSPLEVKRDSKLSCSPIKHQPRCLRCPVGPTSQGKASLLPCDQTSNSQTSSLPLLELIVPSTMQEDPITKTSFKQNQNSPSPVYLHYLTKIPTPQTVPLFLSFPTPQLWSLLASRLVPKATLALFKSSTNNLTKHQQELSKEELVPHKLFQTC